MAEAIARHGSSDVIDPESAGVHPLGFIDKTAIAVLTERAISIEGQTSKGLHSHLVSKADLIVNMSGMPGKQLFHNQPFEEWAVEDPFGENMETHRRICDDIERRVADLAARLRANTGSNPAK
jgi:arsenate reductase